MSEPIAMFDSDDPAVRQAYEDAQRSFKYLWRELSWERRRIVPALDMAMIKLPFTDGPRTDGNAEYEQMWVGDVDFDGETLSGVLGNAPNWLTSVQQGDAVQAPFSSLKDWVMTADGRAYGGFTVNLLRAGMNRRERKQHDELWGVDFGDPAVIKVELDGERDLSVPPDPDVPGFIDHPMCVNMVPKYDAELAGDPSVLHETDQAGLTLLHHDALAGNLGIIKLMVRHGADITKRTPSGRTAADLARAIGWPEIADYLDGQTS
ncbi:MAG TPA: DUF2314 domain-containing protein [Verrucomicrobiae bacterium]|nr:DUF2314 domain-containing protein [Verrucomicrobiae bacterium]